MNGFASDFALAGRSLRRAPGSALSALVVVALGTGAFLVVVALVAQLLDRELPVSEPERVVVITREAAGETVGVPLAEIPDWQTGLRGIEGLAGVRVEERVVRDANDARVERVGRTTPGFFRILGLPGAGDEVATFERRPGSLLASPGSRSPRTGAGSRLDLEGTPGEMVGVLPRQVGIPSPGVDLWQRTDPRAAGPGDLGWTLVARLSPDSSSDRVAEEARRVLRALHGEEAGTGAGSRMTVRTLEDAVLGPLRPVRRALWFASLLLLTAVATSLGVLLLARDAASDRLLRVALGADRWRAVRPTVLESLWIAGLGTTSGLVASGVVLHLLRAFEATGIPGLGELRPDLGLVLAVPPTALLLAAVAALGPLLRSRLDADPALVIRSGRTRRRGVQRWLGGLVVAQVAVAVVLVLGNLLLFSTVDRLMQREPGSADPTRILTAELRFADRALRDPAGVVRTTDRLLEAVRGRPGVLAAGVLSALPPERRPFTLFLRRTVEGSDAARAVSVLSLTPGTLESLGMRPARGTDLSDGRAWPERPEILLSASAAEFLVPDRDPVGPPLEVPLPPFVSWPSAPTVRGIVADVHSDGLDRPASAALYLPWSVRPTPDASLVLRTEGDPRELVTELRSRFRELAPGLPVPTFRTLERVRQDSIAVRRLAVRVAFGLSLVALGVALGGLFGLSSGNVERDRVGIAVRMALGASPARIVRERWIREARPIAGGLVLGAMVALAAAPVLEHLLVGVGARDPLLLLLALIAVGGAGMAATHAPARRAATLRPTELLRPERR